MTGEMEYPDGATPLDPNELGGLKFKHITTREELDELEQANIESGLRWLARHRGDVLTDDFAITLHKRLFGEVWDWAGSFRRTGKNIGIDPIHVSVELRTLMDDARYWAEHETYPASEAAIRLHPTGPDTSVSQRQRQARSYHGGYGADARLWRRPIDWAGGHDLQKMNERRVAYIAALKAADQGDIGPLIQFIGPRDDLSPQAN